MHRHSLFITLLIFAMPFPAESAPVNQCVAKGVLKTLGTAGTSKQDFGITIKNGKVIGRNGDPVSAAFDIDQTFVRAIASPEEARKIRRISGRQVVTIKVNGTIVNYEVLPGMVDVVQYLEKRGIRIHFFSAGDPERNRALLKALRIPGTQEPLFQHIEGRLISSREIRFNMDPLSQRPDILKPVRPLGHDAAGMKQIPVKGSARPEDVTLAKRAHANMHNAFTIDDLQKTSIHEIWIPAPEAGGPPYDWAFRKEYILGVFSEAVRLAVKNPGMSLGTALRSVQKVNLLDKGSWIANPLIERGKALLR